MDKVWIGDILVTDLPTWFDLTLDRFEDVKNGRGSNWVNVLEVKPIGTLEGSEQTFFDGQMSTQEFKRPIGRPKKYGN